MLLSGGVLLEKAGLLISLLLKRTDVLTLHLPPSHAQVAVKQCPRRLLVFCTSPHLTCCSSALLSACASSSCALARSSCPRSCCRAALYSGISACTSAQGCVAASRRVRASACGRTADCQLTGQSRRPGSRLHVCEMGCSAAPAVCPCLCMQGGVCHLPARNETLDPELLLLPLK